MKKYYNIGIVRLWNLENLINYNETAANTIKKILNQQNLTLIDENNYELIAEKEKTRLWTRAFPPLRNTGWILTRTKVIHEERKNAIKIYPFPWKKETILPTPTGVYPVRINGYTPVTKQKEWVKKEILRTNTFKEKTISLNLKNLECRKQSNGKYELWDCKNTFLAYDATLPHPEYFIKSCKKTEILIKQSVENPFIEWLQPYSLVKDRIYEKEEISSNFIVIKYPNETITLSSNKPIKYKNMGDKGIIISSTYLYLQYSHQPSYNMLSNIRFLIDPPIESPPDIPNLIINIPSIILVKQEIIKKTGIWHLKLKLSNVLETEKLIRIYVPPPHYIVSSTVLRGKEKEEIFNENPNSIILPIARKTTKILAITLKKKRQAKIFNKR